MKIFLIILTLISTSLIGCTTVEHNKISKKSKYKRTERKLIVEVLYNASDEMLIEYMKAVNNYEVVKNLSSVSDQKKQKLDMITESYLTKILTEKNTTRPVCDQRQTIKDYLFIELEAKKSKTNKANFDLLPTHRAACVMRFALVAIANSKS